MLWHDLDPVSVRVCDEINAHSRIFIDDTAHFLMLGQGRIHILDGKGRMELVFAEIIGLFSVFEPRQLQLEISNAVADIIIC